MLCIQSRIEKGLHVFQKGDAHVSTTCDLLRSHPAKGERTGTAGFPCESPEQWEKHAAFMDALADDGFVILGGPLGDGEEKFLLIVAAENEQAIEVRLAGDPWTPLRLLRTASVKRWEILLKASK